MGRRIAVGLGLLLLGGLAVAFWLDLADTEAVGRALSTGAPWIPLLFLLEGLRIAAEVSVTRRLAGGGVRRLGRGRLWSAHLAAYAVGTVAPGGRLAAETVKAASIAPAVGGAQAARVGIVGHVLALLSVGLVSVPCAMVALVWTGPSLLTVALALHALVLCGIAALLLGGLRSGAVERLTRGIPRLGAWLARVGDAARQRRIPPAAAALLLGARLVEALEYGVLFVAVGHRFGLDSIFLGNGVDLIASAVGNWLPGQLGATETAFAAAAPTLGVALPLAVSVVLLRRVVQGLWVAAGALAPLLTKLLLPPPTPRA